MNYKLTKMMEEAVEVLRPIEEKRLKIRSMDRITELKIKQLANKINDVICSKISAGGTIRTEQLLHLGGNPGSYQSSTTLMLTNQGLRKKYGYATNSDTLSDIEKLEVLSSERLMNWIYQHTIQNKMKYAPAIVKELMECRPLFEKLCNKLKEYDEDVNYYKYSDTRINARHFKLEVDYDDYDGRRYRMDKPKLNEIELKEYNIDAKEINSESKFGISDHDLSLDNYGFDISGFDDTMSLFEISEELNTFFDEITPKVKTETEEYNNVMIDIENQLAMRLVVSELKNAK
jgi:hypothetical protein